MAVDDSELTQTVTPSAIQRAIGPMRPTARRQSGTTRLEKRGLLVGAALTNDGYALRFHVEEATDLRAGEPYERALRMSRRTELLADLARVADDVIRTETIPFPNPMGLVRIT